MLLPSSCGHADKFNLSQAGYFYWGSFYWFLLLIFIKQGRIFKLGQTKLCSKPESDLPALVSINTDPCLQHYHIICSSGALAV